MADTQLPQQKVTQTPPVSSDKMHLRVRNRTRVLFDDNVKALSSRNDTGIFDILPEHSNFISLINQKLIVHQLDGKTQEIPLNNGVIKVKDNTINCYIDLLAPVPINPQTTPMPQQKEK